MRCRAISQKQRMGEKGMNIHALKFGAAAAALLAVSACNQAGNAGDNASAPAQTPKAQEAAGDKTIASGLAADSKFMAAAKAAGLDQTLAGPGPYTVLVPDDAAFTAAPEGAFDAKPENRAALTGAITNMILPGTVTFAVPLWLLRLRRAPTSDCQAAAYSPCSCSGACEIFTARARVLSPRGHLRSNR